MSFSLRSRSSLAAACAGFLLLFPATSQTTTVECKKWDIKPLRCVCGTVMNPLDEPIPRAKVTILNDGTAQAAVTAGEDGRFSFDSVKPGHYELLIEADHFRTLKFPIVTANTEKKCKNALSISLSIASENCAGVRIVKR